MSKLTKQDFSYTLPEHLVAHHPLSNRDDSKLLVRSADGSLRDSRIKELPSILPANCLLILNNTKVFPSRLVGQLETGGAVEIFLLSSKSSGGNFVWQAIGRPFRKLKPGRLIQFAHGLEATIASQDLSDPSTPTVSLKFNLTGTSFDNWLEQHGIVPLPPYIKRDQVIEAAHSPDKERYQTVYAKDRGSVAAPTAGLHITQPLLEAMQAKGITIRYTCLHVGAGTFMPVKADDISAHKMHEESYNIPSETLASIKEHHAHGNPIIAVGTTSFRSVESLVRSVGGTEKLDPISHGDQWSDTGLFIYPETKEDRYRSAVFDGMMTNFHQPESTLIMLIAALVGYDEVFKIYNHAIASEYRFFSYGDSSLLWF